MLLQSVRRQCNYKRSSAAMRSLSSSVVPTITDANGFDAETSAKDLPLATIQQLRQRHLASWVRHTAYRRPPLLERGHMQWLFDSDGKRYLDLFGGIVTVSVGHCHPKINAALQNQAERLWHTTATYLHPAIHSYAQQLVATMPPDSNLTAVLPVNSGSDANDLALLLARLHTGNNEVRSLRNGYHGMSLGTMGMAATRAWQFAVPGVRAGIQHAVNPDPYRGRWGGSQCRDSRLQTDRICDCPAPLAGYNARDFCCRAENEYVRELRDLFAHSMPNGGGCAAMFVESIQGVGGVVQYPRGYVRRAAELVRQNGGLMVADEVQTGFGRTGDHFWGFQSHAAFRPDIVTMAKGIANGFPMGAVVTTPTIAASLTRALHFNTFGGNPLAARVASAVLHVIKEQRMQLNCREVGAVFMAGLADLRHRYPTIVGDVRGKGLMIGVEMVEDRETRAPLDAERMAAIWEQCKDDGVLLGRGGALKNVFRLTPPMCVTKADAEMALEVFERAVKRCAEEMV